MKIYENIMENRVPRLIEPNIQNYMLNLLDHCHENRTSIYFYCLNIGIVVLFVVFIGLFLFFSYRNKLSPEEMNKKNIQDYHKIMNYIKMYKEEQDSINKKTMFEKAFQKLPSENVFKRREIINQHPFELV